MHPKTRELRTASLLTTFGNRYHVQYHSAELGVHVQTDTSMVPIGPSSMHRNLDSGESPDALKQEDYIDEYGRVQQNVQINQTRN